MTNRFENESTVVPSDTKRWTCVDTLCVVGIVLFTTLLFLPSISERPLGGTVEAKSALVARKMLHEGRWFVAEVDVATINKPPIFYWSIAAVSLLAGGVTEWTVRLPNMLACVATVLFTWALGRSLWDRRTGLISAGVLATMVQFRWLGLTARIDSMVTLSVTAALFFFWKSLSTDGDARNRRSWRWSIAGYLALAFGVGAKGPFPVVVVGLAVVSLVVARRLRRQSRLRDDLKRLHPLAGFLIIVALTAPLFYGMDRASDGRFVRYFFLHENLARAGIHDTGPAAFRKTHSFFYYFGAIWPWTMPWGLLLPAAFVLPRRSEKGARAAWFLPMLAFAVPFLCLSLVSVKKWAYLMPIFPSAALLCGRLWCELLRDGTARNWFVRWHVRAAAVFLGVLAIAMVVGMVWLVGGDLVSAPGGEVDLPPELHAAATTGWSGLVTVLAVAFALVLTTVAILQGRFKPAFLLLLATMVLGLLYFSYVIEPRYQGMISQRAFARRANDMHANGTIPPDAPVYVCAGEPYELVFYLDFPVRIVRPPDTPAFLLRIRRQNDEQPGTCTVVILKRKWFDALSNSELGPLRHVLTARENESIEEPLVLATVKLIPTEAPKP